MKLMNLKCRACGHEFEDFVHNECNFGDLMANLCPKCHGDAVILVHACDVRTPMNSASFLDGHRDDGGQLALGYEKWKMEREIERAKLREGNIAKAEELTVERKSMDGGQGKIISTGV